MVPALSMLCRTSLGGSLDLDGFDEKLGNLSDATLEGYIDPVPKEWREGNDLCESVVEYLSESRQHRSDLINNVRHILR